jgi:pyruvate formate lyase activating enzyme
LRIAGFQKLTLLDYPGTVACILFTPGCNFRCPFCQNAPLLEDPAEEIAPDEVLAYLAKRRGIVEGLVVSGGEPLLQPDLPDFLREVKALGCKVKLDTNGSFPKRLAGLLADGLTDYVAMDIKHRRENYFFVTGLDNGEVLPRVEAGMALLRDAAVPCEFRTTFVKGIHTPEDAGAIGLWIGGSLPYYLQNYEDSGNILMPEGLSPFSAEEMAEALSFAQKSCPKAALRGVGRT